MNNHKLAQQIIRFRLDSHVAFDAVSGSFRAVDCGINKYLATSMVAEYFKCFQVLIRKFLIIIIIISSLPYISNLLEKVVERRLKNYLDITNLHDSHQSAYRNHYSTETVLVKVLNAEVFDHKDVVVLIMLGMSCAFDVIDHGRLHKCCKHLFDVIIEALDWMRPCVSGPGRPLNFM